MDDDMRVERDIMVPMRDGIKLACDVYRPAAAGQTVPGAFPVILERTPYGKGQTSRSEIARRHPQRPQSRQEVAACFVRHGYVVVYQQFPLLTYESQAPMVADSAVRVLNSHCRFWRELFACHVPSCLVKDSRLSSGRRTSLPSGRPPGVMARSDDSNG